MNVEEDFAALATADDADIDLARAAFAIARDEHPQLDVPRYLDRLDRLADAVREGTEDASSTDALLRSLDHTLFAVEGFGGNADDYYDPANSYLNRVMDRRRGIPITLCVLYIEVAQRAGVGLEPVGFPSHFLVAHGAGAERRFIDPFHQGRRLGEAELRAQLAALVGPEQASALFDRAVEAVPRREVVARMLRNLKLIHTRSGDWARALPVSHRLVALDAGGGPELRDRGRILEHLEAHRAALADYERYLAQHPDAEDARAVESRLEALRNRVGRLN